MAEYLIDERVQEAFRKESNFSSICMLVIGSVTILIILFKLISLINKNPVLEQNYPAKI